MSVHLDRAGLRPDFAQRLEDSLVGADHERQRRVWLRRLRALLPLVLLAGPVLGWRLTLASPDGVHAGIAALAWVTFLLDVGVHVDTDLLTYLGLGNLPVVVGALLFIMVAASVLWRPGDER